jgi:hypothetical protein
MPKKKSKKKFEKNSLKNLIDWVKNLFMNIYNRVKKSFIKSSKGDENFYLLLWGWGIVPALMMFFYFDNKLKFIHPKFVSVPIYFLITLFFIWHIFSIRVTIKKHPEYKEKKENKKEKYKGLSKEKIKELKREEKREKNKDMIKKALLLKAWDTMEFYKIVILIDLVVILTQIQRILYILK